MFLNSSHLAFNGVLKMYSEAAGVGVFRRHKRPFFVEVVQGVQYMVVSVL
jgi:hypothetical protein